MPNKFAKLVYTLGVVVFLIFGDATERAKVTLLAPTILLLIWFDWFWVPKIRKVLSLLVSYLGPK